MFRSSLICLLALVGIFPCSAQNYKYIQYTSSDGLPTNYVYGVIEDSEGYIWAYSENGISKYDGYTWETFDDSNGLPSNDVYALMQSKDGTIWGQTYTSESFAIRNDSIVISHKDLRSTKMYGLYNNICFSGDGLFHINDTGGLADQIYTREQEQSLSAKVRLLNDSLFNNSEGDLINGVYATGYFQLQEENYKYYFSPKGVLLYNLRNNKYIVHQNNIGKFKPKDFFGIVGTQYGYQFQSEKAVLFFNNRHELYDRIDFASDFSQFDILSSYLDSNDNLWIGTRSSGLLFIPRVNRNGYRLGDFLPSENTFEGLFQTPYNQLVGINDNSEIFKIEGDDIQKIASPILKKRYSNHSTIPSLGISIINRKANLYCIDQDLEPSNLRSNFPALKLKYSANAEICNSIVSVEDVMNLSGKIIEDQKENRIYMAHRTGIYYLDNESLEINSLICRPKLNIYEGYGNRLLASYEDSLILIRNGEYRSFKVPSIRNITCVIEYQQEQFLIGTQSEGVFTYNHLEGSSSNIFDCKYVKNIKHYQDRFYIASYSGIHVLDSNFEIIHYISERHGLHSDEVNELELVDSNLYAATSSGIIKFDNPVDQLYTPEKEMGAVQLLSFIVNGNIKSNSAKLRAKENNITVEYTFRHYPSGSSVEYEYRLLPEQSEWRSTSDRSLSFYNLSPNEYKLEIRAKDIYGFYYSLPRPISFKIPTPFYQTIWFITSAALLFILGSLWIFRSRENKQRENFKKKEQTNKRIAELQLTALRSQMNPHFVYNVLGSIQYFIQKNDAESAEEYLADFADLMRMYLDFSSERIIKIQDEVKLLELYVQLEKLRFEEKFEYKFEIADGIDVSQMIPSMLIQPFVENAIHHGVAKRMDDQGLLTVSISEADHGFEIIISDNGKGFSNKIRNRKHKSKGLSLVRDKSKMMEELNLAKIDIDISRKYEDESYPGTMVTINLSDIKPLL